ncbi:MAG: hypothetical protein H0U54_14560 [Acidobacteria bacterium]|jgi:hypothetical protein|nr:hypothetical protein [Acidobacteriota bacterium]
MQRINKAAGRALLLIYLAVPVTWAAAQHGGKAEGRRVRFERGRTTATYKGQVRGSTEVEYELKGQTGQELIVRVVTNPPDSTFVKVHGPNSKALQMSCLAASVEVSKKLGLASEASCFEDDPQKLRRNGQTWLVTLPQSGAYTLSVFKPGGGSGVSAYTLTIIVRQREKQTRSAMRPAESASLDAAMRKFIAALMKRDVEGFLSLFSRTKFFYASNPLNVMRVAVSYSELAADLRNKGDWYFTYLERGEGGAYDAFVDNIGDGQMWLRVGDVRFVPLGSEISNPTCVKWRREGGKWVIDEISYPQA